MKPKVTNEGYMNNKLITWKIHTHYTCCVNQK